MPDLKQPTVHYESLKKARVIVTGGASGIGETIVRAFHAQGAQVALTDIDSNKGNELKKELGKDVFFLSADASDMNELQKTVANSITQLGGLDCLVNNVGNDMRQEVADITAVSWRQCMSINLDPVFFASQTAAPALADAGGGAIINLSSINANLGPQELAAYSTAKAGILGLTRSLADAFGAKRIRVNAILPGWVITDKQLHRWITEENMTEWKKYCRLQDDLMPEDIANMALFLASDQARMITNQSFVVDAGRT